VNYSKGEVTFRYLDRKNPASPEIKELTLPVAKFLELWAQHIPPATMHTIRVFGLYASGNSKRLEQARSQLVQLSLAKQDPPIEPTTLQEEQKRCSICSGMLVATLLQFAEPVRPWHVFQTPRDRSRERSPPMNEEYSVAQSV
jgi:hypothetical protein